MEETKRYRPLLPRLHEGPENKVGQFSRAGVWDARPVGEIDNLGESLKVDSADPKYFDVDSIPDMWARPLLFEMALYNPAHVLHDRVLGEWRGLLALLALKELRGVADLKFERVRIDPGPKPERGAEKAPSSGPDFLKALARLAPGESLAGDTTWLDLYVILFDKQPIGITSPTTLVCTAADCYGRINNVAWFGTRFLEDPTKKLSGAEKEALAGWLDEVRSRVNGYDRLRRERTSSRLLRVMEKFIEDLGGVRDVKFNFAATGTRMEGIFSAFDHYVGGVPLTADRSHVRVVPSEGKKPPFALLVVDKTIAAQWRANEQDVILSGTTSLATVPFGGLTGPRNFLHGQRLVNAEWRVPADFFTDKLFVVAQESAFPNCLPAKGADTIVLQGEIVSPLVPLKEEILNYLSAADLAERVEFETGPQSVIVRLSLPLSGFAYTTRDFEIVREYRWQEGEVVKRSNVPVLEVWPDFQSPDWSAYYTYYSTADLTNTFYAKPFPQPSDPPTFVRPYPGNRDELREVTQGNAPPEAMVCLAQDASVQSKKKVMIPAGLLLIRESVFIESRGSRWKVGIDFGTTGTNVYARESDMEPVKINVEPRLLHITDSTQADRLRLYDEFIPDKMMPTPFLSLFSKSALPAPGPYIEPLLDGRIYFLDDVARFDPTGRDMLTDLKWGGSNHRFYTQAFLEQLCLQCSAEIVARGGNTVAWRFSFPTAFSVADREDFAAIWEAICRRSSAKTGLVLDDTVAAKSESLASAQFFVTPPERNRGIAAPVHHGVVCIDIGGGTSDISVWQGADHRMQFQSSLRFAGRDLIVHLLHRRPRFLSAFRIDTSRLESLRGDLSAFSALADAIIKQKGQDVLETLANFRGTPEVAEFVQLLAIGLGGLLYYVGIVLRGLSEANRYTRVMPHFYIGGNGARLFHWLAGGQYGPNKAVTKLFRKLLFEATGFRSDQLQIHISPEPKSEVAYGLVREDVLLNCDQQALNGQFMAGEAFVEGGRSYSWQELLDAARVKRGIRVSSQLEQFRSFLKVFNESAEEAGILLIQPDHLTAQALRPVVLRVDSALANASLLLEREVRVEPLFVSALKYFLEIRADEWATKHDQKQQAPVASVTVP